MGKDSNSTLGTQCDLSQSRCGEDAQSICISEILEMHLFPLSIEKEGVKQGDIPVGQCTLPWAVG